ncbi:MAG TPA: RES family NAD+ phosphorylase [Thermoanaerobaculia bacterium]|nr:RES family NAD+ phosphorylase [Thermoanaerobaculia bacterium]
MYNLAYLPTAFNPGIDEVVRGRFHFFCSADAIVPVLYGAEIEDAAIAETILQLSAQHHQRGWIFNETLKGRAIVSITPAIDLRLIELCGAGLQKLRLLPEEITSTRPSEYPRTIQWAKALHGETPEAHGLLWMSHQFNTSKSLMLFGDRIEPPDLVAGAPVSLSGPAGRALLEHAIRIAGLAII